MKRKSFFLELTKLAHRASLLSRRVESMLTNFKNNRIKFSLEVKEPWSKKVSFNFWTLKWKQVNTNSSFLIAWFKANNFFLIEKIRVIHLTVKLIATFFNFSRFVIHMELRRVSWSWHWKKHQIVSSLLPWWRFFPLSSLIFVAYQPKKATLLTLNNFCSVSQVFF